MHTRHQFAVALSLLLFSSIALGQITVATQHNDLARTGQNLQETILTPANVNQAQFGKLFSVVLDGQVYTQPLYVPAVSIPGAGMDNVVYVATEHDSVYAFDADGQSTSPLWQVSFIDPANGITTVPNADTGASDIIPEIGITGTPVIDPATQTLYVVALTKEITGGVTNYVQRLHALDLATGTEKFGGPVVIQASVPGTGNGSSSGSVPFNALRENQRDALLLLNGVVYIGFGSHNDVPPYHGWVLGYDAATLQQVMAFNTTPNANGGGVWQSGDGIAADDPGTLFLITANGAFDANSAGGDYSDSFLHISPSGSVLDYFAPFNQSTMAQSDLDLGSGGNLLLPDQPGPYPHLMVSAGKDSTIYVIDRDNMGQFQSASDSQIVQEIPNAFPSGPSGSGLGYCGAPVYWNSTVYFSSAHDSIKAFSLSSGLLSTSPVSQSSESFGYPGAALSISANQNSGGILWAVERISGQPGVLHAYDATNLATELYNSNQAGSRDLPAEVTKFTPPTVANGKVYVAGKGELDIFGMLPDFSISADPASQTVSRGGTVNYTINTASLYGFSGSVTFSCSGLPQDASCAFNPASQVPAVSGTDVGLQISTSSASAAFRASISPGTSARTLSWLFVAFMCCVLISPRTRRHSSLLMLALGLLFIGVSCGGGPGRTSTPSNGNLPPPTTPSGSYSISVTASSGALQHSVSVNLIVQ